MGEGARLGWAMFMASLGVALMPACGDNAIEAEVRALGAGCLLDSDCEGDTVCVFRRCHVECNTTADCRRRQAGTRCVLGERPTHVCLLPDESDCRATSDCPSSLVCARDGACRDGCTTEGDCLGQQQCLKGGCADGEEEAIPSDSPLLDDSLGGELDTCRYTSECARPLACRTGLCEPECITERDCPEGAGCELVDGDVTALACVPSSPDMPPHCVDGLVSGDESDVDCGGNCVACPSGAACTGASDCVSNVCRAQICQVPTCTDEVENGDELAVDCGGSCVEGCAAGSPCNVPSDCQLPAICLANACTSPTCSDGIIDGAETGLDCGGPTCDPCAEGEPCDAATDCESSVCQPDVCVAPSCDDGVHNGAETAVDCGGTICSACGNGASCATGTDCATGSCVSNLCAAPSCDDGVMNGFERAVDCGGDCPSGCPINTPCAASSDCDMTIPAGCFENVCTAARTLTVTTSGTGSGTVLSVPPGRINCGGLCTVALFDGEEIVLPVIAGSESQLIGFTGACSGFVCTVTAAGADLTVDAAFGP